MKKLFFTLLTLCLCGTTWAYDFDSTIEYVDGTSTTFYYDYILDSFENHVDTIINGVSYPTVEVTYYNGKNTNAPTASNPSVYTGDIIVPETVVHTVDGGAETCYVVGIGYHAFQRSSITSIVIPGGITYLKDQAVGQCTELKSVILQESDTPIKAGYGTNSGQYVFFNCSALSEVVCNRNIELVDHVNTSPFGELAGLTKVSVGGKATEVCNYGFWKCPNLTDVTLSDSITTIKDRAFSECTALEKIVIPASVKTFGNYCMAECTSLKALLLLDTDPATASVGENDFADDVDNNIVIYVPRGTAAAYVASSWNTVASIDKMSFNFYNLTTISEDTKYTDEDENNTYYYATYYYDKDGEGENDIYEVDDTSKTLYAVTGVDEGVVKMEALSGDIIPKNTPLLIESSTPGAYYMWRNYYDEENNPFYEDGTPTTINNVPTNNMLYGHSESGYTSASNGTYNEEQVEDYYFYKLSLLGENEVGSVGFYWGASDGGSYEAGAHRCWLAVLKDSANGADGISIKKDNGDTTGISSVESAVEGATVKGIYTIQGVRVSNTNQPGLYIVDGKKVLVK